MTVNRKIAVIGLGYVGLPVATAFGVKGSQVIAYDINKDRVIEIKNGEDKTGEVSSDMLAKANMHVTDNPDDLAQADFYIVTVPTPINNANQPDLKILLSASATVGNALNKGDIVVYESTVYPGATEEDCVPILEQASGLKCGSDFTVGYSPERINPGDKEHRFETITKIVSGQDDKTLKIVSQVYGSVVKAGIHEAPSIKVAETAKVLENTQRDINIALMNELSVICQLLNIDTHSILEAAGTKWNFLNFTPGLVGGHCIGVDPFYLTHRAEREGYHPEVILSGRRINNEMGKNIARHLVKQLVKSGAKDISINILGFTFKPDVPDTRNTKVIDIIKELEEYGITVQVVDYMAESSETISEYGLELQDLNAMEPAHAVILAVPHKEYKSQGWDLISSLLLDGSGIVFDVAASLDPKTKPRDIRLMRL